MKFIKLLALLACAFVTSASAGVVQFNLLGRGGAGLLATNEPGAIIGGTGGEIGAGITFDDVTRVLSINVGWGSANGFSNLSSAANNSHIHGPTAGSGIAAFSQTAGVLINLPRLSNSASAGSIVTNVTLTAGQAVELLAGRYYVNVHTVNNGGGEARGFLVPALITVTTNLDGGPGSLRQAALDLGTNGSPCAIAFAPNLSGATITLTNEIALGSGVILDASNLPGGLTLDGGPGANRIFTILGGTTNVLRHLTLTGGNGGSGIENGNGGAIFNGGSLTLTACTVSSNSAASGGGGIFCQFVGSELIMNNCTVSGNTAAFGGALLLRNSTAASLVHCTVSGNTGTGGSGGVVLESSATLALQNTIIAGNPDNLGGEDIGGAGGTLTRSGNNIIGVQPSFYQAVAPVGAPNGNGDYVGTNGFPVLAQLAGLSNYGGLMRTMRPLPNSPAINAATSSTTTVDQRGFPRPAGPFADIGAVEFQDASTVVVNNANSGPGSLRYAVAYCPVGSTITFTNTLSGQTIQFLSEIALTKNLTIDASGLAGGVTLRGKADQGASGNFRLFNVTGAGDLTLRNLTLAYGGGTALSGNGGAIYAESPVTLTGCTLTGNYSPNNGGAIFNNTAAATISLVNCTLTANTCAAAFGGAIANDSGSVAVSHCTIVSNSAPAAGNGAGGGIFSYLGAVAVTNSIVAGNTSTTGGADIHNSGTLTFAGSNLVQSINSGYSGPAPISAAPLLAALGNYGGPTATMRPLPGSPAIDGCTGGTSFPTDQRGFPRIAGSFADIGAVEFQDASPVVLNNNDSGPGSLRDAVAYCPVGSTITFTNTLSGQTILLTSGELSLRKSLVIDASSLPNGIIVDAGNASRVFNVLLGRINVLTGLTLKNGLADRGGAVFNLGNLTLNRCTVAGSSATGVGVGGGGLYNEGVLTLNDSTVSGNSASGYGGGIENYAGMLTLNQSTVSGNACDGDGGGGVDIQDGTVSVNQSTVTGNSSSSANGVGGVVKFSGIGTLTIYNSIVAGNSAPVHPDIAFATGTFTALGNNFTNGNPLLAPLGHYGGPTPTCLPLPGSPVIDGCTSGTSFTNVDQRGFFRLVGAFVDIGSVESGHAIPGSTVVTSTNDAIDGLDVNGVSLREAITFSAPSSTITFATNLSGQTILLTNGQLTLDKSLTIDASMLPNGITINGNQASRIFEVATNATVALNSLTISNGYAPGGYPANIGAGIYNLGTLVVNRCTLAGNWAAGGGGGIMNWEGTLTVNQCTFKGNSADGGGAIATVRGLALTVNQCTLSGNTATGVYPDGLGADIFCYVTPQTNINSIASDVFNNQGGLTLLGMNLIQTYGEYGNPTPVNPAPLTNSPLLAPLANYGGPTPTMPPLPGSPAIDAGGATSFTTDQRGFIRSLGAGVDIGSVESGHAIPGSTVVTSTNDAIDGLDVNGVSLREAIAFSASSSTITFATNLSGQTILLTNGQLTLDKSLTIDASALAGGITLDGNGGASRIFTVAGGTTNALVSLRLVNGYAGGGAYGYGGAIYCASGSALSISRATLHNNSSAAGGAIYCDGATSLTMSQCTLTTNSAINAGAIGSYGTLTILQCTVAGNSAGNGGGIYNLGTLALTNSIVAGNSPNNFAGNPVAGSNNLTTGDPSLAPLGNYGGPTPTMPPLPGSPAIDAGGATSFTTDQRGFARLVGPFADIGAVEFQDASPVVVNYADSGPGSLRYAVTYCPVGSTITFDPSLSGQTIGLTNGQITLNRSLSIDGSGLANGIAINGNNASRIFEVNSGSTVVLTALTIVNGTNANVGGGVYNNSGASLTLNKCTLAGNSSGVDGGGIYNNSNSTLTVIQCTLAGNGALYGGGLYNYLPGGTLTVDQSTISGNAAVFDGGGIYNWGTLNLHNSIVAGNTPNQIINRTTLNSTGANLNSGDPLLAPLGNYGGPTPTMPPMPGSPAVDAAAATSFLTDQRGFPRTIGAGPDIGAVEGSAPPTRLLAEGGPWKYLADGSDQGTAWRGTNFNDSAWSTGVARLGFGGDGEVTAIANAASNFVTFYFRQTFNVANAVAVTNLFGQIQVDDGVILYLNGTEIYRRNMTNAEATLNYRSLASATVNAANEQTFWTFSTNSLALVNGVNVLAAEVHQAATNSSDLGFNLDLVGNYFGILPPVITVTSPTNTVPYNAGGLPLLVTARDPEGTVTNVDFYVDGLMISRVTNAPFTGLWTGVSLGAHYVQAVATDDTGLSAVSQNQPFTVILPSVLTTLVNSNSTWRYLDDGSDQGTLWRTNAYNDAGWSNGVAELGYGDGPALPEATVIRSTGTNGQRIITTYFRKGFSVADPARYSNLVVRLRRDDGGVVYLNGVEIFRSNMTNGSGVPVLFTNLALNATDEVSFFSGSTNASLLRAGDNLVAVEIHQTTAASSDVSFDLQLQAESGPQLFISQGGGMVNLNWLPIVPGLELQYAPTPSGPWTAAPSQLNPQSFTTSPADLPVFWRLAVP